jgi:hypothetical protein
MRTLTRTCRLFEDGSPIFGVALLMSLAACAPAQGPGDPVLPAIASSLTMASSPASASMPGEVRVLTVPDPATLSDMRRQRALRRGGASPATEPPPGIVSLGAQTAGDSFDFGGNFSPSNPIDTVLDGNQVVAKYNVGGDAVSTDSASYGGGNRFSIVPLQVVFWGSWWQGQTAQQNVIINMVNRLLATSYLDQLAQYAYSPGGVTFGGAAILLGADPGATFKASDAGDVLWGAINNGAYPDPQDNPQLFMVFTPQTSAPAGNFRGQHTAEWNKNLLDPDFIIDGVVSYGDVDYMADVFSHELVEMITDPGPNQSFPSSSSGMLMNRSINGGKELGDACNQTVDRLTDGLLVQAYWSNNDKACIIPLGAFIGNGPSGSQAVIDRTPTHLDLFWVAPDGSVSSTFSDAGTGIAQPFTVAPANSALPGGFGVTTVARAPDHLDIFWVGNDGSVRTAWWDPRANSANWNVNSTPVGPSSGVTPGSIAAVTRNPDQLDVFWIDANGAVWSNWWNRNANSGVWNTPFTIAPAGSAQPGALEAVARTPNQLDVFWIGPDGSVMSNWWNSGANNANWHTPFSITPSGAAVPGGLSAVSAFGPDTLDVFYVGPDGSLSDLHGSTPTTPATNFWRFNGLVSSAGTVLPASGLAATPHAGSTGWQVFWLGIDRSVQTSSGTLATQSPVQIAPPGSALSGAITAMSSPASNETALWIGIDASINGVSFNASTPHALHPLPAAQFNSALSQNGPIAPVSSSASVGRLWAKEDVFWTSRAGAVNQNSWDPINGWVGTTSPLQDASSGQATAGGVVAAVSRQTDKLDIFWTAPNGLVTTSAWEAFVNPTWTSPSTIDGTRPAPAGAPVSVVSRDSNSVGVFWVENGGTIAYTFRDDNVNGGAWASGSGLSEGAPGSIPPGNPVAAVARDVQNYGVFWVGNDGSVNSATWAPPFASNPLLASAASKQEFQLAPPGSAPATAPGGGRAGSIAAVARTFADLDAFWVANDGSIMSRHWDLPSNAWSIPFSAAPPGSAKIGTPLVATSREAYHIDLVWIAPDNSVKTAYWDQFKSSNWATPIQVAPPGSAVISKMVSASSREENHLDVFWVSSNGTIMSNFWDANVNNGNWNTPFAVSPANAD